MVRARWLPPAWALKRIWLRSPPSITICSASSSALLPAPLGAMIAVVRSSSRVWAWNRKNCTRWARSSRNIVFVLDGARGAGFVFPVLVHVVLVQPLQPLRAGDLHDRGAHQDAEGLRVVGLAVDFAAQRPAAQGPQQGAQAAGVGHRPAGHVLPGFLQFG